MMILNSKYILNIFGLMNDFLASCDLCQMSCHLVCGWHSLISTLQNSCEVIGDFYFLESFIFETFEEYDILLSILLASFSLEGIYFHINWDEHREESLDAKMEREVFSSGCIMFRAQETVSHLKSEVLI